MKREEKKTSKGNYLFVNVFDLIQLILVGNEGPG
jgi:hypothetical protein